MKTYLVGGAVRDKLLGRPVKERDYVVVGSTPAEMLAQGFTQVGKDFPVFLHPRTKEEYALARTERKAGHGYQGFRVYAAPDVTLEEDLLRRDLTINAIAESDSGEIIDPFNGRVDLENNILRHVSPAFVEDPVRVLRIARFAAQLGFDIGAQTQTLLLAMVRAGEVDYLTPERVWQELFKTLNTNAPEVFLQVLRRCGALAVIMPELDNLYGVPARREYHPEVDTGIHTELVLQQAVKLSASPKVRFAALLHDLGKALTPINAWPSHHGHGPMGIDPINQFCDRLKTPQDYRELALLVATHHITIHKLNELNPKTIIKLLNQLDAFRRPERLEAILLACEADAKGRLGAENKTYPQASQLKDYLRQANTVDVQTIIAGGSTGAEIGLELDARRARALTFPPATTF